MALKIVTVVSSKDCVEAIHRKRRRGERHVNHERISINTSLYFTQRRKSISDIYSPTSLYTNSSRKAAKMNQVDFKNKTALAPNPSTSDIAHQELAALYDHWDHCRRPDCRRVETFYDEINSPCESNTLVYINFCC